MKLFYISILWVIIYNYTTETMAGVSYREKRTLMNPLNTADVYHSTTTEAVKTASLKASDSEDLAEEKVFNRIESAYRGETAKKNNADYGITNLLLKDTSGNVKVESLPRDDSNNSEALDSSKTESSPGTNTSAAEDEEFVSLVSNPHNTDQVLQFLESEIADHDSGLKSYPDIFKDLTDTTPTESAESFFEILQNEVEKVSEQMDADNNGGEEVRLPDYGVEIDDLNELQNSNKIGFNLKNPNSLLKSEVDTIDRSVYLFNKDTVRKTKKNKCLLKNLQNDILKSKSCVKFPRKSKPKKIYQYTKTVQQKSNLPATGSKHDEHGFNYTENSNKLDETSSGESSVTIYIIGFLLMLIFVINVVYHRRQLASLFYPRNCFTRRYQVTPPVEIQMTDGVHGCSMTQLSNVEEDEFSGCQHFVKSYTV